ncbi:MAG: glycosyltransferase family 4 protein [Bacteroidetes bacterium]|nr:glycosyltransferase family 4 protein [Bacteroidota bacterium]
MKIALITDGIYPYVLGGMQKHSYYLAKYLAQQGVEVDLFHYNQSSLDIDVLDVFTDDEKKNIHSYVLEFPESIKFPGHYIYRSYKYSEAIYELIRNKTDSYDFIYTKGFSGWKLISEKKKGKIQCCPIGVKFHGYEMFQVAPDFKTKLQHYMLRPFVRKISREADVVFSYGGKITELITALGIKRSRIIEIPSGIESRHVSNRTSPTNNPVKFVFLGRYERRKGIEELNEVLLKMARQRQEICFGFIGPIPEEKKLNLPGITYFGEIRNYNDVKNLLIQHDVLVCPSWSEGFPNVILEAMASGLAVIATDTGAVSRLVDQQNGELIKVRNKQELEAALDHLSESALLEPLKEASLSRIKENFTWEILISRLIKKIEAIVKQDHGS